MTWVTVNSFGRSAGETEIDRELERAMMRNDLPVPLDVKWLLAVWPTMSGREALQ